MSKKTKRKAPATPTKTVAKTNARPEQLYLDGTAPPKHADVERLVDHVLDDLDEKAAVATRLKMHQDALLACLAEHGLKAYPYVDRRGKRKLMHADATPRIKSAPAPKGGKRDDETPEERTERLKAAKEEREANSVEVRRVPRTEEHDKVADPFGKTRSAMNGAAETPAS